MGFVLRKTVIVGIKGLVALEIPTLVHVELLLQHRDVVPQRLNGRLILQALLVHGTQFGVAQVLPVSLLGTGCEREEWLAVVRSRVRLVLLAGPLIVLVLLVHVREAVGA